MTLIRDSIRTFLAESGNIHEETPPNSGNFVVQDYRPDGSRFHTAASENERWINLASGVTPTMKGRATAVREFTNHVLSLNADRPPAKYAQNQRGGLVLTASYPAHVHSERYFSDNLADIRNAQCTEVPALLKKGTELGIDFGFSKKSR